MRTYENNFVEGRFNLAQATAIIDGELDKLDRDRNAGFRFTGDDFVQYGLDMDALAQRIEGMTEIPALTEIGVILHKNAGDVKKLNHLFRRKTLSTSQLNTLIGVQYDECTAVLPSGRPSRKVRRPFADASASACHAG
jgi:tRNA C32,U32 (ribose-2'-O)-methylase TrmJ